jgi:hypothetical protein
MKSPISSCFLPLFAADLLADTTAIVLANEFVTERKKKLEEF